MKKLARRAAAVVSVAALLSSYTLHAQDGTGSLIGGGVQDANTLLNAYASPLLKAFGTGLNGGWFNTAKPHGIGGFDITITGNIAFAPVEDQTFDLNNLKLNYTRLVPDPNNPNPSTKFPTIFGSSTTDDRQLGLYKRVPGADTDSLLGTFKTPTGIGTNMFPVPATQLAVGVGYGTEVAIRFTPELKAGAGTSIGMFGFAVKHDFKQWIPAIKEMPFDLSAMFGYTTLHANIKLDALEGAASSAYTYNPNPNRQYNDEKLNFKSNAFTINVLLSKRLSVFTPYLGLGYQYAKTTLGLAGTYPVTDVNENFDPNKAYGTPGYDANDPNSHPKVVKELHDPISIIGTISNVRATFGARLHLAVLTLHADYTLSTYDLFTIGVGLNIQSIKPFKLF